MTNSPKTILKDRIRCVKIGDNLDVVINVVVSEIQEALLAEMPEKQDTEFAQQQFGETSRLYLTQRSHNIAVDLCIEAITRYFTTGDKVDG